uniref:Uncharacterized protein n=1 Tax=Toxoplasma gondii COUG TaxID=1074873 RepID=A0A2G8Y8X3_TOXGO|nr:hypothetical protein TGCOUG_212145 [Toxoplasma gondii COUG]
MGRSWASDTFATANPSALTGVLEKSVLPSVRPRPPESGHFVTLLGSSCLVHTEMKTSHAFFPSSAVAYRHSPEVCEVRPMTRLETRKKRPLTYLGFIPAVLKSLHGLETATFLVFPADPLSRNRPSSVFCILWLLRVH